MYKLLRGIHILTVTLIISVTALALWAVPFFWMCLIGLFVWKSAWKVIRSTAHGTARWATPDDVPHLLTGSGVILGHLAGRPSKWAAVRSLFNRRLSSRESCRRFLTAFQRNPQQVVRLTNAVHTAVFAPTGVGKGVSCVLPFVLTCTDSMVIFDVKGEIAHVTAKTRRAMGHRVMIIDPYKVVTQHPDTFNPLEFIDKDSETALDDVRDLAAALVIRNVQEKEPHWADSAEVWIAAMIAAVVCFAEKGDKSLQSVRQLLTNPDKMQAAIALMCESDAMHGMLSRLGYQLGQFRDKELSSTLTTTNRFLRFLDTLAIADSTAESTFDPADLVNKKTTVYLVLPPERMRAQASLIRLWMSSLLRAVVKCGLQSTTRVHFVLDEAASLGHLECMDDAVDKLRGYGVRLLFIYQSLAQIRKVFPDGQDQNLLGNATQIFFGVNDQQTADYVSARLGEKTIVTQSGGTSAGTSRQWSDRGPPSHSSSFNENHNWNLMGRKLLKPEEVLALPERVAITFAPGLPPIATRLIRHYEKDFKRLKGLSLLPAMAHTATLFVAATVLAVMLLAAVVGYATR